MSLFDWFRCPDEREHAFDGVNGDVVALIKDTMSVNRWVEVTRCAWKGPRQAIVNQTIEVSNGKA